ncbi:ATP-grasp domain-containing protein [Amantichitinum ursilacus]|uniref:ATP-grasp domain-containing protein n=1 Tax=Amantichitinum ursilacus TaxID=857265 RepID=A0A0N0GQ17_9NEIS|nr:hypothetical protein [Amantichitinum ursilacus]KPC54225.1 hypothetical protein WG78_06235 [Amantichitinum ursilacus]
MSQLEPITPFTGEEGFVALAPFLRASIAGEDMNALADVALQAVHRAPEQAERWINLSTAMMAAGREELGLSIQAEGLAAQTLFRRPAALQPARVTVLIFAAPGPLSVNTPLDCLLEFTDVELLFCYLRPDAPMPASVPDHDVVFVAIGESAETRDTLARLSIELAGWPRPVINPPQNIPNIARDTASALLQDLPGLVMPPCWQLARTDVQLYASGVHSVCPDLHYPLIVRPLDSHGGHGLARIADDAGLAAYLAQAPQAEFYIAPFMDYRSADGQFRKYRVLLLRGEPFACHMAISSDWMIHYVNAGMYEEAAKRAEEAQWMRNFAAFAQRHAGVWHELFQRSGLDYLAIDCAEMPSGELLIFEIDHAMVIHAMDSDTLFPHKQDCIALARDAVRHYLLQLSGKGD